MNNILIQRAEQLRFALQKFIASLPEEEAIEIPTLFDEWNPDESYLVGTILTFEKNGVGDPQLYKVKENKKKSNSKKSPKEDTDNFTPIGVDGKGNPLWARPTGKHDTYDKDDVVSKDGVLYISNKDNNKKVPGEDKEFWSIVE